jgi:hypothetical protein
MQSRVDRPLAKIGRTSLDQSNSRRYYFSGAGWFPNIFLSHNIATIYKMGTTARAPSESGVITYVVKRDNINQYSWFDNILE